MRISTSYIILLLFSLALLIGSCAKEEDTTEEDTSGSCIDGIQNRDELGVDCGGRCPACPTHCFDFVRNFDEVGVDCGGPCTPCVIITVPDCPAITTTDEINFNGLGRTIHFGVTCGVGTGSLDENYVIRGGSLYDNITITFSDTVEPAIPAIYTTDFFVSDLESDEVRVQASLKTGLFNTTYSAKKGQEVYVDFTGNNEIRLTLCEITMSGSQSGISSTAVASGQLICD